MKLELTIQCQTIVRGNGARFIDDGIKEGEIRTFSLTISQKEYDRLYDFMEKGPEGIHNPRMVSTQLVLLGAS
jgi:hypothetical protein